LGIKFERAEGTSFILQVLDDNGMRDAQPVSTPKEKKFLPQSGKLPSEKLYRNVLGLLLYIANISRPDILITVFISRRRIAAERDLTAVCVTYLVLVTKNCIYRLNVI